jgi:hypothetical protein
MRHTELKQFWNQTKEVLRQCDKRLADSAELLSRPTLPLPKAQERDRVGTVTGLVVRRPKKRHEER